MEDQGDVPLYRVSGAGDDDAERLIGGTRQVTAFSASEKSGSSIFRKVAKRISSQINVPLSSASPSTKKLDGFSPLDRVRRHGPLPARRNSSSESGGYCTAPSLVRLPI